jgi:hypothetical protein
MNYLKVTIQILIILTIGISIMFVTERKEITKREAEAKILAHQLQLEKDAKIAQKAAENPYRDKVEEAVTATNIETITDDEIQESSANGTAIANKFEYEEGAKVSFAKQGLTEINKAALNMAKRYKYTHFEFL